MPTYKKVKASSRKAALQKIQSTFGDISITILKENVIKGKKKLFFGKEEDQYELTVAMYEEKKEEEYRSKDKKKQLKPVIKKPICVEVGGYDIKGDIERVQKNRIIDVALHNYPEINTGNRGGVGVSRAYSLKGETAVLDREETVLEQAKSMMKRRTEEEVLAAIKARKKKVGLPSDNINNSEFIEYTKKDFSKHSIGKHSGFTGNNVYVHPIYNFLIDRDFSPTFVKEVINSYGVDKDFLSREDYGWLAKVIANQVSYAEQMSVVKNKQNFIYFVGPTGVGKTTTLAKIAASFFLDKNEKKNPIGSGIKLKIASFDNKRMMAMEQMGVFAKIIKVPFRKLFGKDSLITLMREVNKGELVLVDTSGVSVKEQEDINEVSSFINLDNNIGDEAESNDFKLTKAEKNSYLSQAYLCLNVGYRYNDLKRIYKAFSTTGFSRVILTKQDESYSLGSVLSLLSENDCELAYLTDGQDVPNDLQVATAGLLEQKLIQEWSF